jgi:hypothetical protein
VGILKLNVRAGLPAQVQQTVLAQFHASLAAVCK